ncbi:transmembrane protein [Plecomyxo virus]|nr:transmembrane protein [Plecomyxo virus]
MDRRNQLYFNNTFNFNNQVADRSIEDPTYESIDLNNLEGNYCSMRPINSTNGGRRRDLFKTYDNMDYNRKYRKYILLCILLLLLFLIGVNLWMVIIMINNGQIARGKDKRIDHPVRLPINSGEIGDEIHMQTLRTILKDTSYNIPKLIRTTAIVNSLIAGNGKRITELMNLDFDNLLHEVFKQNNADDYIISDEHQINMNFNHTRRIRYRSEDLSECNTKNPRRKCVRTNPTPDYDRRITPKPTIRSHIPRGPPGLNSKRAYSSCRSCLIQYQEGSCKIKKSYLNQIKTLIDQLMTREIEMYVC